MPALNRDGKSRQTYKHCREKQFLTLDTKFHSFLCDWHAKEQSKLAMSRKDIWTLVAIDLRREAVPWGKTIRIHLGF